MAGIDSSRKPRHVRGSRNTKTAAKAARQHSALWISPHLARDRLVRLLRRAEKLCADDQPALARRLIARVRKVLGGSS